MSLQMIETLHRMSLLNALEPEIVFKQIAAAVAEVYGTPDLRPYGLCGQSGGQRLHEISHGC